ncbi:hypothetical protein Lal_00027084 [Lupinus albus]|nr:hypothetical protein Lal_00027084 [Lupinus albus]
MNNARCFAFPVESNAYYPKLVRVFYCNLNLRKNRLISFVKGKEFILEMKTFSSISGDITYHGSIKDFGLACDWDNYDKKEFYYSMCRFSKEEIDLRKLMAFGETVKNRDILVVGNLNIEDCLLHYFHSYVIMPMFSNHSQINDIELQLMYAFKHNLEINWAFTCGLCERLTSPCLMIISKILEHFDFSTAGESKITLNARDSQYDVDLIRKMGLYRDLTDRVCKHRSDRPTTPVDPPANAFVNPPAPQPSTFHSESSSSTHIP